MQSFVDYLIERELIPRSVARQLGQRQFVREPVGMIAVGHGLLTPQQIDEILDRQRQSRKRFGEVAVELGYLTGEQVESLVKVQEFGASSEIVETLALSQILPIEDAARHLAAFLREREVLATVAEK